MNQANREKYRIEILNKFNQLDSSDVKKPMFNPTPAFIKGQLLQIATDPNLKQKDKTSLQIFLGISEDTELLKAINKDTEVYKTVQNFFKEKTKNTTKPGLLDLANILVTFYSNRTSKIDSEDEIKDEINKKSVNREKEIIGENPVVFAKQKTILGTIIIGALILLTVFICTPSQSNYGLNPPDIDKKTSQTKPTSEEDNSSIKLLERKIDSLNASLVKKPDTVYSFREAESELDKNILETKSYKLEEEVVVEKEKKAMTELKTPSVGTPMNFNTKPISAGNPITQNEPISLYSESVTSTKDNNSSTSTKSLELKKESKGEICFVNPNYYERTLVLIHKNTTSKNRLLIGGKNTKRCFYEIPEGVYRCEVWTNFTKKIIGQFEVKVTSNSQVIQLTKNEYN